MRKVASIFFLLVAVYLSAQDNFVTHVTLTTYNAVKDQCDDTPDVTADGTRIDHQMLKNGKQRLVAVSRDLLCYLPYGSVIDIEGHGKYIVADTMHERFDHHVDILQHVSKPNFKKEKIKVKLIRKGKK